jgi:hypothetical protein
MHQMMWRPCCFGYQVFNILLAELGDNVCMYVCAMMHVFLFVQIPFFSPEGGFDFNNIKIHK